MVRLDKFLSDAGVGTRTELKAMIRQGRVTVDGEVVKKPEQKVTEQQTICA
ncbi:MAG: S4 domain-containing protein, partial [Oscillospiraceae bacterium]|nr:S4 domain-containing protein [Oscillospiraceae bacterium]